MNTFSIEKISAHLTPAAREFAQSIQIFQSLPSTNDYLLKLNKQNRQNGVICLTESQSDGRGRNGKHWNSPACGNIYLSLAWEPAAIPKHLSALSLITGLIAVYACQSAGATIDISIKWPNDLLIHHKKFAGILIETLPLETKSSRIVIGIGINLNQHAGMQLNWTSLNEHHTTLIEANHLVGELINQFSKQLPIFAQHGLQPFQSDWQHHDALWQRVISTPTITGIAQGITAEGQLIVRTDDGKIIQLNSGEVSIGS